ncbi:MAG: response regulator [Acidobacteria bacterium]|nr:response regulator [Acidobacteriota bacterium]
MDSIRVLVIEDSPGDARMVGHVLGSARGVVFEIRYARDLGSGLELLKRESVDVVLLDLQLPDAWELDGVRRLNTAYPDLPIVALTGLDMPQTIRDTIKIGVRDYFVKGRIDSEALIAAILRQTARAHRIARAGTPAGGTKRDQEQRIQVLVVEDNPGDYALVRHMLAPRKGFRFDLVLATKLSDAIEKLRERFDVILLDLGLPDSKDIHTLQRLRAKEPYTPVLIITGIEDRDKAVEALANGAQDYLVKGHIDGRLLSRAILRHVKRAV